MDILDILTQDYRTFPNHQTYEIYAEDVYFKDPMNEFQGRDRYQDMIRFIQTWLSDPQIELHHIQQTDRDIRTDWTLSLTPPLPWKPRVRVEGWSELQLNRDGLICSHIDYWKTPRLDVLKQHFPIFQ